MIVQFETLSYNGFAFPVESKLEVEFPPRYDQADRAVVGVAHSLHVTVTLNTDRLKGTSVNGTVLTGVNEADMPVIKAALTQAGQALVLTGTGFGDLSVNGTSAKKDSAWGPKPRHCSFMPLGTAACVLRWRCDVQIPSCLNAGYSGQLMAYNYAMSVNVDEQGYCTRTISGYFEIPLTRQGGADVVTDSAINYWDASTQPPVPPGFRRLSSDATESEDRRKLNFRVVDAETNDIILPPNCVECRASHSVQTLDKVLTRFAATLRASYTMRKGVPKQDAFILFLILLYQKWQAQLSATQGVEGRSLIPMSLTLEDPDIYGRVAGNFSATWQYTSGKSPSAGSLDQFDLYQKAQHLVSNSALWNPGLKRGGGLFSGASFSLQSPPGNSWSKWRQSMDSVFGSQMPRFKYQGGGNEDVILDLCGDGVPPVPGGQFFRVADYGTSESAINVRVTDRSFLKYDTALLVKNGSGKVFNLAAAAKVVGAAAVCPLWGVGLETGLIGDVQLVSPAQVTATLFYNIIQVGTIPLVPALTRVGNVQAVFLAHGKKANYLHAVLFGVPAYGLKGFDTYLLKTAPNALPALPPNFFLATDSSTTAIFPNAANPLAAENLAL